MSTDVPTQTAPRGTSSAAPQHALDRLGEAWNGRYDIVWASGLYWAMSTTDRTRLAADTPEGLQALLIGIA